MSNEITMGSLFDGIGGFPLAAIRNGITPVWASEIEKFPIEVTKLRFPSMVHVGDITKLNGAELPPVDIICGGHLRCSHVAEVSPVGSVGSRQSATGTCSPLVPRSADLITSEWSQS